MTLDEAKKLTGEAIKYMEFNGDRDYISLANYEFKCTTDMASSWPAEGTVENVWLKKR